MTFTYPPTRIDAAIDTLSGVSFADPYRWLEPETEEVKQWQSSQAALASSHVGEWADFERLRQWVGHFSTERFVSLPRYAAGMWFRQHVPEGASQAQALVSKEPMGAGRVLFDPKTENHERPPFLSWISPSPDGRTLAVGVCADGSENNSIRLIDVTGGKYLADPPPQTLMDNWTGGVQWLPDSSGFFFSAITGPPTEFSQQVYLHHRHPVPKTERVEIPWTELKDWRMVVVSLDGHHAVAIERLRNPIPVAIAELGKDKLNWRPFANSIAETLAGYLLGERFIAITDIGAPRGRLIAIPINAEDPNDSTNWHELVAESDATLRTVTPVGEVLYLTEFVDTYARVRIVDRHGKALGEVPLPEHGAVMELPYQFMNLALKGHPAQFLFGFSSLTVSPGIHSHTPGQPTIETLKEPQVQLENALVEDRWAVSADGERIPYHLVRRADVDSSRPQPTLIYAYGGFNVPLIPQFPGPMGTIVAAGGIFVHAHLRGGAEFGRNWWEGGRMSKKQNCYHDLYAVAEDLIAAKRCTPQSLAVTGASNGGLMVGVAVTQRPDLWAAAVPRVPFLDLVGGCREPYGRMSVKMEFADIEVAEEVRRMAGFSPYHLVQQGIRYPAVFIDAGDTDPRCPPWHARKFAASLQAATGGSAPILLHIWENAGHGWATDKKLALNENTEWLAFVMRHLGLDLPPADVVDHSDSISS